MAPSGTAPFLSASKLIHMHARVWAHTQTRTHTDDAAVSWVKVKSCLNSCISAPQAAVIKYLQSADWSMEEQRDASWQG